MSERKKGKERVRERLPFLAERSHPERRERREEEGVANNERGRLCFQPLRTMNDAAGKREEEEERRGWKGGEILLKAEKRKRRAMYTSPFTAYEWESCCERRRWGVVWWYRLSVRCVARKWIGE